MMTRRGLFGVLAGLLGVGAVGKLPVEAVESVAAAPIDAVLTAITSSPAATDLTIESLEAALQRWRRLENIRFRVKAINMGFAFDDTERGWHYINE